MPWLFDNHVIYDGHANTYELKYKDCSLTLTPLPPHKPLKFKSGKESEKTLYMSETWVKWAISKSKHLFALLMVESNTCEEVKLMHHITQSLLREFMDVFPNYLPLRLASLRGIKHQIDLLLGAPLSNKSAYRCNPNE